MTGYTGGREPNPTTYDRKDHKEAVRIIFDPTIITFEEIMEHFLEQGGLPVRIRC
jgi:peptide-methionine (S)-S-oxide reductase